MLPARPGRAGRALGGQGVAVGPRALHVLSVLPSGAFPGVDDVDIYEFLDRHTTD